MKAATLVGYHGHKNLGDDIFLRILMKWLSTSLGVGICSVTARVNTVENSVFGIKLNAIASPIRKISRLLWVPVFYKALKSEYLIFAAGSIFTIQPFFLMYSTLRLLKFIRGDSLKIMAIGVSIGPFKNDFDKYWCFRSLSLMDSILLRDHISKDLLNGAGLNISYKLSYDLALCWGNMFTEPKKKERKENEVIGLALTSRGFGGCTNAGHSGVCESITGSIQGILKKYPDAEIRIFSICSDDVDGDIEICEHIRDRLLEFSQKLKIEVYNGNNIEEFLSSISECTLMIASRMHAGIMAMSASMPVYQISYAEKISGFYEHCKLSSKYLYDADDVTRESLDEFLSQGMLNNLSNFFEDQNRKLKENGKIVYADLMSL